ncbi:MAG: hypothetical protein NC313_10410 [Butyrivibrio sp.]|nr:hypothetical protein [Butyrivibrio sp.]
MTASALKKLSRRTIIFIMTMALVCSGAVLYIVFSHRTDIPNWVKWESGTFYDDTGEYEIELRRKSAIVKYNGDVTWSSPDGVKVQQALSSDIDNDGYDELILLCWRQGHFGAHKPFWIDETEMEDTEWSQHIFVYEYGHDLNAAGHKEPEKPEEAVYDGAVSTTYTIRPKWQSSYIGQDVVEISISGSKTPDYRLVLTSPDGEVSIWHWDSWGFVKEDE